METLGKYAIDWSYTHLCVHRAHAFSKGDAELQLQCFANLWAKGFG